MTGNPAISVLMPVYNTERYLSEAIESILNQTYENFEFIIVDDGSTDRSSLILQEYAETDSRIRLIRQENTGMVGALNRGLKETAAPLIARMDADDVALPHRLEAQLKFMENHPEHVVVGGHTYFIDPDGQILKLYRLALDHNEIEERLLQGGGGAVVHAAAMFRKSAIEEAGGYRKDFEFIEDFDLYLRLLKIGKFANLDRVVYHYRHHLENITARKGNTRENLRRLLVGEARRWKGLPAIDIPVPDDAQAFSANFLRRRWCGWALEENRLSTAWKHAWRAWIGEPWSRDSVSLLSYVTKKRLNLI